MLLRLQIINFNSVRKQINKIDIYFSDNFFGRCGSFSNDPFFLFEKKFHLKNRVDEEAGRNAIQLI